MSSQALATIQNAGFELLRHPPYSPDLTPSDFYLFPKLKEFVKGHKFADDKKKGIATEVWPKLIVKLSHVALGE